MSVYGLAQGADGNVWFASAPAHVGKVANDGAIATFPLSAGASPPLAITQGPDGNMWFTELMAARIGRVTPQGEIEEFDIPDHHGPRGITAGGDGNVWFAEPENNRLGRITPTGSITEFVMDRPGASPFYVTLGHDCNVWFLDRPAPFGDYSSAVGRIAPDGQQIEFAVPKVQLPSTLDGIATGGDGNIWFSDGNAQRIGRVTRDGAMDFIASGEHGKPTEMTTDQSGNIWFYYGLADQEGTYIARISPQGNLTAYPIKRSLLFLEYLTAAPDNTLWFGEGRAIGRVQPL